MLCVIFTPLLGYFVLRMTGQKNDNKLLIIHYICERCELEFTQYEDDCPICKKEGYQTKLSPRLMKAL